MTFDKFTVIPHLGKQLLEASFYYTIGGRKFVTTERFEYEGESYEGVFDPQTVAIALETVVHSARQKERQLRESEAPPQ